MAREKIILVFQQGNVIHRYKWVIKKGIRGVRDAKKVRKLQGKWGDPIEIIGDGHVANLLRKEYEVYNKDKENYPGVSEKNILTMGVEVSGLPVKKIQQFSKKIMSKVKKL